MFSLFRQKRLPPAADTAPPPTPHADSSTGLMQPEPAASLLATPRRRKLLEHIWQRTSLSRPQFDALYRAPLQRYAELVQQFPASESHHHAYPGGMLDHGLEIVAYALKLRQSHLLPAGATPEAQAAQAEAWTAGIAYAALLHDIGKIAVDLQVEYADGTAWHPWHGPLCHPYRFRYRKDREYRLHGAATGLLYAQVLGPSLFDWLSGYPDLWTALLYALAGQYEHAGMLGELVTRADQASVAQTLGGDPVKALAAPRHALQRKLLEGLRYLLKEQWKLNQPQASDGWLTDDALWLVSKTVSDKLRAHLLSQGVEGIPSNNTTLFNVLQEHGMAQPTADGKAIWKATITSENGWSHSFTLLRLAPALIWESHERPTPFTGSVRIEQEDASTAEATEDDSPTTTTEKMPALPEQQPKPVAMPPTTPSISDQSDALLDLFNLFDTPASPPLDVAPSPTPVAKPEQADDEVICDHSAGTGEHFLTWLKHGIHIHKLIINDAKALVHVVSDSAYLVSPGLFQRYAQEHPHVAALAKQDGLNDWQWVQKRFEKLHLHRKQSNGLNIWTCQVTGPRKSRRVHGYLLESPTCLFETVPPNNPYLSVIPHNG